MPSRNGAVLNVAQAQAALRGHSSAGAGEGVVFNMSIDARGAQAGTAEQIDAALARRIPELARRITAIQGDRRRRGLA